MIDYFILLSAWEIVNMVGGAFKGVTPWTVSEFQMRSVTFDLPLYSTLNSNMTLFFVIWSCSTDLFRVFTVLKKKKYVKTVTIKYVRVIRVEDVDPWLHFLGGKTTWQMAQNADTEMWKRFCLGVGVGCRIQQERYTDRRGEGPRGHSFHSTLEGFLCQGSPLNPLFRLQISWCKKWGETSDKLWKSKFNEDTVPPKT